MTDEQRLAEAEDVLHQLKLGQKTVTISSGGKSTTYNQAKTTELEAYIASLRARLGLPTGLGAPFFPTF